MRLLRRPRLPLPFRTGASMAASLTFEDLLDFVALEPGRDPAALKESLRQDPGRVEALAGELAGSSLARVRLQLGAPITLASGEAPLLAAQAELEMKHLHKLLKRQAARLEVPLGPLVLQANASVLGHLQDLIRTRLDPVVDEARGSEHVSLLLAQSSCDTLVESGVDEALQRISHSRSTGRKWPPFARGTATSARCSVPACGTSTTSSPSAAAAPAGPETPSSVRLRTTRPQRSSIICLPSNHP